MVATYAAQKSAQTLCNEELNVAKQLASSFYHSYMIYSNNRFIDYKKLFAKACLFLAKAAKSYSSNASLAFSVYAKSYIASGLATFCEKQMSNFNC